MILTSVVTKDIIYLLVERIPVDIFVQDIGLEQPSEALAELGVVK